MVEATSATIYDLTEPGRPMWMRFGNSTNTAIGWVSGSNAACVAALNAKMMVGCISGAGGMLFDFAKDTSTCVYLSNYSMLYQSIATRNTFRGNNIGGVGGYVIANATINAVAMTVLPDAPVDPVSGLQVPTIACGTAGGVSVIKHDGTVVSSSSTAAHTKILIDEKEVGAVNASGFSVSGVPGGLGASFAMIAYTVSSIPALMGVPTVMA